MVSKQEDRIDFGKLEQEALNAFEADAHYNRENDAKFRAVNQRVATYDEFRDIVLASHIKPLEKNDLMNPKEFKQQWNILATKNDDDSSNSVTPSGNGQVNKKLPIPKNGHEFTKEWRKLVSADKYNLLLGLGGQTLGEVFKSEISFGLLGEFIDALLTEYNENQAFEILVILQHLCKTKRFQLSIQFLSSKEKEMCEKLFDKIQQAGEDSEIKCDIDPEVLNETKKHYGILVQADS